MKTKKSKQKLNKLITEFELTQAYENIRANIMFSIVKSGCKKIIVTSSYESEGKSTVASNIAKQLSKLNVKVLLIDMDFRHPTQSCLFNFSHEDGLSDLIISGKSLSSTVKSIEEYPNLHVITTGTSVPSPSNLLASKKLEKLLSYFEEQYEYVIIDTPPINIISDALYVAKYTDGVILVVKEGSTTHPMLKKAMNSFELINIPILGFILNSAKRSSSDSHYSGYHSYYYNNYEKG